MRQTLNGLQTDMCFAPESSRGFLLELPQEIFVCSLELQALRSHVNIAAIWPLAATLSPSERETRQRPIDRRGEDNGNPDAFAPISGLTTGHFCYLGQ